jgi:hypothetical protein
MNLVRIVVKKMAGSSIAENGWFVLRIRLAFWLAAFALFFFLVGFIIYPFVEDLFLLHLMLANAVLAIFLLLRNLLELRQSPVALKEAASVAPIPTTVVVPAASVAQKEAIKLVPAANPHRPLSAAPLHKETSKVVPTTSAVASTSQVMFKEVDKIVPADLVIPGGASFKPALKAVPVDKLYHKETLQVFPQAEAILARSWEELQKAGGMAGGVVSNLVDRISAMNNAPNKAPDPGK